MICPKCKREIPEDALFCLYCGRKIHASIPKKTKRPNGTGTVIKVGTNNYKAIVVVGYKDQEKKLPVRRSKSGFKTKAEAINYLPSLYSATPLRASQSLISVFEEWFKTKDVGDERKKVYLIAKKRLEPFFYRDINSITINEMQAYLDSLGLAVSPQRTFRDTIRELWEYAIPRNYVTGLNIGKYLNVAKYTPPEKESFTDKELEVIRENLDKSFYVPYIYILCYTGFRIGEFASLTRASYDPVEKTLKGGSKTKAGKNRIVTISPKILPLVERCYNATEKVTDPLFPNMYGKPLNSQSFPISFETALKTIGIDPQGRTPHSCRHTFATLMKNVSAAEKDKLKLIGHASSEMLLYYQESRVEDLRKITDKI